MSNSKVFEQGERDAPELIARQVFKLDGMSFCKYCETEIDPTTDDPCCAWAEIDQLTAENERLRNLESVQQIAKKTYNGIWGILYPSKPDSWDYPAQITRHVRHRIEELVTKLESSNRRLKTSRAAHADMMGVIMERDRTIARLEKAQHELLKANGRLRKRIDELKSIQY